MAAFIAKVIIPMVLDLPVQWFVQCPLEWINRIVASSKSLRQVLLSSSSLLQWPTCSSVSSCRGPSLWGGTSSNIGSYGAFWIGWQQRKVATSCTTHGPSFTFTIVIECSCLISRSFGCKHSSVRSSSRQSKSFSAEWYIWRWCSLQKQHFSKND